MMNFTFWNLFHSLIRHGNSLEEIERSEAVHEWAITNMKPIAHCLVDTEAKIMPVLYDFLLDTEKKILPDYALIKEKIGAEPTPELALEALKEYESIPEGNLNVAL
jgi:hypothetical protein